MDDRTTTLSHHRKIDLQSPADLLYLLENVRSNAREKIDVAIPKAAAPEGEDAYRLKVEELVQAYIIDTFRQALPSLTINGFDANSSILDKAARMTGIGEEGDSTLSALSDPSDEEIAAGNYEMYDPRLAERLRNLYSQFESEAEIVARLRREAPRKAALAFAESLEQEIAHERRTGEIAALALTQQEAEQRMGKHQSDTESGNDTHGEQYNQQGTSRVVSLDSISLQRSDEIEQTWAQSLEKLGKLQNVPALVGKMERAIQAADFIQGS